MIAPELIEQIRDAADVVALIGEHVELKRTGTDYRGPCPFHGGTHRNFSVVPRKQMYHCFVCHESGDVFTFWMKKFGLDYPTAVREIAGKVGIVVPESRQAGPDPNEPLYSALGVAADWFARRLREADDAAPARAYVASRALDDAARDQYQLGYAPARGSELLDTMRTLGVTDDALRGAGLVIEREGGEVIPRFRGRLIFPIADVRGRVVGFGGRLLGDGEPKYLNSPETAVFHKGTNLYGLDRARNAIRSEGLAVIVEGYVDVIRLQAAGIGFAVAPLGTALTGEQARVLHRYTKAVALALDADAAGLRSTFRAGDELLREGVAVSVVTLPPGEDPDTLVAKGGAEAFRAALGQAVDLFERKIQLLDRKGLFGSLEGRRRALDRLLPTIRAASDPITRGLYLARAAEKSGVGKDVLEQEVGRLERSQGRIRAAPPRPEDAEAATDARPPRSAPPVPDILAEQDLVHLMLTDPAWVDRVRREVKAGDFRHPVLRAIAGALLAGAREADEATAADWERLARPREGLFDAQAAFAGAVAWFAERDRRAKAEEKDRLMPAAHGDEEKTQLMKEKVQILQSGPVRPRRKAFEAEQEPKH